MVLTIYVDNCWHCWHCNGTAELQPIARLRVSGDRTAGRAGSAASGGGGVASECGYNCSQVFAQYSRYSHSIRAVFAQYSHGIRKYSRGIRAVFAVFAIFRARVQNVFARIRADSHRFTRGRKCECVIYMALPLLSPFGLAAPNRTNRPLADARNDRPPTVP